MPWVEDLGHFYVGYVDAHRAHRMCTTLGHGMYRGLQLKVMEFSPESGENLQPI